MFKKSVLAAVAMAATVTSVAPAFAEQASINTSAIHERCIMNHEYLSFDVDNRTSTGLYRISGKPEFKLIDSDDEKSNCIHESSELQDALEQEILRDEYWALGVLGVAPWIEDIVKLDKVIKTFVEADLDDVNIRNKSRFESSVRNQYLPIAITNFSHASGNSPKF